MMAFQDRTFCVRSTDGRCGRKYCWHAMTPALMEQAKKWWGGEDAPIGYMDRHEEDKCPDPEAPHDRCKYCGTAFVGDAWDYYHEKGCQADHVRKLIAECDPNDHSRMLELRNRLEVAQYVGD